MDSLRIKVLVAVTVLASFQVPAWTEPEESNPPLPGATAKKVVPWTLSLELNGKKFKAGESIGLTIVLKNTTQIELCATELRGATPRFSVAIRCLGPKNCRLGTGKRWKVNYEWKDTVTEEGWYKKWDLPWERDVAKPPPGCKERLIMLKPGETMRTNFGVFSEADGLISPEENSLPPGRYEVVVTYYPSGSKIARRLNSVVLKSENNVVFTADTLSPLSSNIVRFEVLPLAESESRCYEDFKEAMNTYYNPGAHVSLTLEEQEKIAILSSEIRNLQIPPEAPADQCRKIYRQRNELRSRIAKIQKGKIVQKCEDFLRKWPDSLYTHRVILLKSHILECYLCEHDNAAKALEQVISKTKDPAIKREARLKLLRIIAGSQEGRKDDWEKASRVIERISKNDHSFDGFRENIAARTRVKQNNQSHQPMLSEDPGKQTGQQAAQREEAPSPFPWYLIIIGAVIVVGAIAAVSVIHFRRKR